VNGEFCSMLAKLQSAHLSNAQGMMGQKSKRSTRVTDRFAKT